MLGSPPFCRWTNWGWRRAILAGSGFEPDSDPDLFAFPPYRPATWFRQCPAHREQLQWVRLCAGKSLFLVYKTPHCLPVPPNYYSSGWTLPRKVRTGQDSVQDSPWSPARPGCCCRVPWGAFYHPLAPTVAAPEVLCPGLGVPFDEVKTTTTTMIIQTAWVLGEKKKNIQETWTPPNLFFCTVIKNFKHSYT